MCATHARSAAVTTGFIGGGLCPFLTARGISVPKASGMGVTWADVACLGTCSTATSTMCNADSNCPAGETCSTSCTPVACTFTPGPPASDNFCFGTISCTCCNTITPCAGDSATPICRPNLGDPPGLLTASFSRASSGQIDPSQSTFTITLDDGTVVTPPVAGTVDFTGQPCPGSSCSVGVTLEAFVTDFTAKGATFSKMSISAGTATPALQLVPVGSGTAQAGTLDATHLTLTLQGTASAKVVEVCLPGTTACITQTVGGTQAIKSQPPPGTLGIDFQVDSVARTFTMRSAGTFAFPRAGDTPGFTATFSFTGTLSNQPPRAVAPPALTVECDSPTSGSVTLDGRSSTMKWWVPSSVISRW